MAPIRKPRRQVPQRPEPVTTPEESDVKAPRDLGVLHQILGFKLRRIQNHLSRNLSQRSDFGGHKSGEFSALAIIHANPGLSQVALADEVGLDKAMTGLVVDQLEYDGLVRRERALDDRRRNLLFATDLGVRTLDEWVRIALEVEEPVRKTLSTAEFAIVSELLDRIYHKCFNSDET